jgi:hypothetical protein
LEPGFNFFLHASRHPLFLENTSTEAEQIIAVHFRHRQPIYRLARPVAASGYFDAATPLTN